jgi:DNA-directed RNA polymerase subunit K/omega
MSDNEQDNASVMSSDAEDSDFEEESYNPNLAKRKAIKTAVRTGNADDDEIEDDLDEPDDELEEPEGTKKEDRRTKGDNYETESENEEDDDDDDDDDDDEDEDDEIGEYRFEEPMEKKKGKREKDVLPITMDMEPDEDMDDNDDDEEDDGYLQKFDSNIQRSIIAEHHPELMQHNYEEIEALTKIVRNEMGVIVDPLHKTLPFLTKYEKARILGERAKKINAGGKAFIPVEINMIDGYLIAMKELEEKKIPFIIKRPMPNGGCEYWKLKDLEILL